MSDVSPTWGNDTEEAFFAQMRGCRDAYRRLGEAFHAVLGAHSAIEFGCGVGDQTHRLEELGWNVRAYDHSPVARSEASIEVYPFDLAKLPIAWWISPADVCICTETAEHIPPGHEEAIISNVVAAATQYIIWSAAPPGQEWPGHVNLKPAAFWLGLFADRGWVRDMALTAQLRNTMLATHAQHEYCAGNFSILVPQ